MTRSGVWLAIPLLVSLTSCSPEPRPANLEALDLVALYSTGSTCSETTTFASQGEERPLRYREGWSTPTRFRDKEWVAAISNEAALGFIVVNVSKKWLEFDLSLRGPQAAPASQEISVFVGQHLLTRLKLDAETDLPVRLEMPPDMLVRGENHVRFTFTELLSNPAFPTAVVSNSVYPSVAAYFSTIRLVGPETSSGTTEQTPAFLHSPTEGTLRQTGPSYMEHAFRLVHGASLDITGVVRGNHADAILECRSESAPHWRKLGTMRGDFQKRFRLPVTDGDIGQLRLTVPAGECAWSVIRLNGLAPEPTYEYVDRPKPAFKHLVFIVLDALRSDMLASAGDRQNLTPNLNRLATGAVVFSNATSASSFTPASVFSYFTGENPYSKKLLPEQAQSGDTAPVIRDATFDLIAAFAAAGYRTVNITGNFYLKASYGLGISFREEHFIWPEVAEDDRSPRTSTMDQEPVLKTIEEMASSNEPVMLYLHYLPPHLPYNPPQEYRGFLMGDNTSRVAEFPSRLSWLYEYGYADASQPPVQRVFDEYKENVHYGDALVGEVFDALAKGHLLEATLVIVIGDHGEAFLEHGKFKHSSTVFDEMIRVPLMFIHPSLSPGTAPEHVGLIDLTPTLVELFDLACTGNRFEGRSLWPLLMREPVKWEDRWYFSLAAEGGTHFGYRTGKLKYIFFSMRDHLFDLASDPQERHSVDDASPLLTAWLRQKGQLQILTRNPEQVVPRGVDENGNPLRDLRDLGYIK
jgi:arylsulfatase A-like enzyme